MDVEQPLPALHGAARPAFTRRSRNTELGRSPARLARESPVVPALAPLVYGSLPIQPTMHTPVAGPPQLSSSNAIGRDRARLTLSLPSPGILATIRLSFRKIKSFPPF